MRSARWIPRVPSELRRRRAESRRCRDENGPARPVFFAFEEAPCAAGVAEGLFERGGGYLRRHARLPVHAQGRAKDLEERKHDERRRRPPGQRRRQRPPDASQKDHAPQGAIEHRLRFDSRDHPQDRATRPQPDAAQEAELAVEDGRSGQAERCVQRIAQAHHANEAGAEGDQPEDGKRRRFGLMPNTHGCRMSAVSRRICATHACARLKALPFL